MPEASQKKRLVDALAPSFAIAAIVENRVDAFAKELDDDDLFDDVVACAERGIATMDFLARVPGLTARQLRYWTKLGLVDTLPGPRGSGHAQHYGADQLPIVREMVRFVDAGVAPIKARELAGQILRSGRASFAGLTVGSVG